MIFLKTFIAINFWKYCDDTLLQKKIKIKMVFFNAVIAVKIAMNGPTVDGLEWTPNTEWLVVVSSNSVSFTWSRRPNYCKEGKLRLQTLP